MGFKANEQEEIVSVVFPKYTGVGAFTVVGINPTAAELGKIQDREVVDEPVYLSEKEGVKQVRIDFWLKSIAEKNGGAEFVTKVSYFLSNNHRYNNDATKVEVVNEFGQSTWVTVEDAKVGACSMDWFKTPYKVAINGEIDLLKFLRTLVGVADMQYYNSTKGGWVDIENLDDAKAILTQVPQYFTGNISEIKTIVNGLQHKRIKFPCGIRTTDDGKVYQDIAGKFPIKYSSTKYEYVGKELKKNQEAGGYKHSIFSVEPLKEYVVEATNFTQGATAEAANPFAAPIAASNPFGAANPNPFGESSPF